MDIRLLIHDLKVLSTSKFTLSPNLREILEASCCYVAAYTLQTINIQDLAGILSIGELEHNFNNKSNKQLILYLLVHLKCSVNERIFQFPDPTVNLYLEKLVQRIHEEFSPIEWIKLEQHHNSKWNDLDKTGNNDLIEAELESLKAGNFKLNPTRMNSIEAELEELKNSI